MGIMHEDGIVPEYECREVALFSHMSYTEFLQLDWQERVKIIAHKRLSALIDQHYQADASLGLM